MRTPARAPLTVVLALVATAACGGRAMFVPPPSPGDPAPDAGPAWTEAVSVCRDARSYGSILRVSGRVGTERLWPVEIETVVTADQSIYLNAIAGGQTVFVLAGTAGRASLWLRADQRVTTAATGEILDAIIGLSVTPAELLAILAGCVARDTNLVSAERQGRLLAITTKDARVYLTQDKGVWRTHAAITSSFTVEFGGPARPPSEIWMWSAPDAPRASLHLRASEIAINSAIPADVFSLPAAARAATPLSIEELRASGPFRNRAPGNPQVRYVPSP
jgi:hypothetical protein